MYFLPTCVWGVKDPKRAACWGCHWGFTFGSALGEGLPRWLSANEFTCQCQSRRRCRFHPWAEKIPQEKEMATRSSILAWRIPWTEEPGGPQSRGSQRVGHDWARVHTHPSIALGGSGLGRLSQLKILSFCFHWTELNTCFWQHGFSFQCLTSLRVSKFHGNPQWLRVHGVFPGMCAGWGFFREWGCGLWGEPRIKGCFSASRSSFSVNSEPRGWNVVKEGGKYNSENMKSETQGDSHALL